MAVSFTVDLLFIINNHERVDMKTLKSKISVLLFASILTLSSLFASDVFAQGTNIALNRPTSASSIEASGLEPDKAVDGSTYSRWGSSFNDNQWIRIDLGQTYNITQVNLNWETASGRNYLIETSNDDYNWVQITSRDNMPYGARIDYLTGLTGSGRYIRMYGRTRTTQYGFSLFEFSVYGTLPNYTLSTVVNPTAGGNISLSPAGGSYTPGTVVTLNPTPSAAYTFTGWSGDLSGSVIPASITMNTNKNVTANFTIKTFTISASTSTGGNISPAGVTNITYGNSQLYTFTPASGYRVASVVVDGTPVTPVPANYTFSNVTAAHTIAVSFSAVNFTLATTSNPTAGGGVTLNPTGGSYVSGVIVTLTPTPSVGYNFTGWSGDLTGSTSPASITMNSNKNVTANFSISTFAISASASTGGNISPAGVTNVTYGNNQLYTCTPDSGYLVTSVVVDGTPVTPVPASYTFSNVTAAHTIAVSFSGVNFTLATTSSPTAGGAVTLNPAGGSYVSGAIVTLTPNPSVGYNFTGWSGDLTGSTSPSSITMNSNKNVTANFSISTFAISASASTGGNISPTGVTNVTYGNNQLYTFTPDSGYLVTSVVVDGTPVTPVPASYTFSTVTAAHTIAVTFSGGTYTLTTAAIGSGTVSPASNTYPATTAVLITATPAAGWQFYRWDGDVSGSSNPVTIVMNANKTVTAIFTEVTPTVPNSNKLSISSRLFDANGIPVGTDVAVNRNITIRLFDQQVGGNLLYTETFLDANHNAAIVDRGYFVVRLGEGSTSDDLLTTLGAHNNVWVEIQVESVTFVQRIPLTAAAYSLQ